MKKFVAVLFSIIFLLLIVACDDGKISWQEEVKLSTGETIVVDQKRECLEANTGGLSSGCLAREAWLTIKKSSFSIAPIEWHENLIPMIININDGKLYIVGYAPTPVEYRKYGRAGHPYFGFIWIGEKWNRIAFGDIPISIYDANMVINNPPRSGKKYINLETKTSMELRAAEPYLRINPTFDFGY
jgi:hypothetical protein